MLRADYRVLAVDAEPAIRQVLADLLADMCRVALASDGEEALAVQEKQQIDVLLVDGDLQGKVDARELVRTSRAVDPVLPILLFVAGEQPDNSDEHIFYLPKNVLRSEAGRARLLLTIERAAAACRLRRRAAFGRSRQERAALAGSNFVIGTSHASSVIREKVALAAGSKLNLLLTGETGVGKTLVAESVHYGAEGGGERPFITVEPATLAPTLFESELFGHARGAFTGATSSQMGAFEVARGGTIFLDEIGDLPHEFQVKLLRVVETKRIRRVGDAREIQLDVRVIAATNRNLEADVEAGRFRADLYQRLNEIRVDIPALRDRGSDVIPLLEHFLGELSADRRVPCEIDPEAAEHLIAHQWPGNVRELRTLARRLCDGGLPRYITPQELRPLFPARTSRGGGDANLGPEERILAFSQRAYLDEMRKHGFGIREAARAMQIPYATLRSRLKSLGLLETLSQMKAPASGRETHPPG